MRCQFCGWDNPQGKSTCEKCNKPLSGDVPEQAAPPSAVSDAPERPTDRKVDHTFNPRATVREPGAVNVAVSECPNCGYQLENGECSACGYREGMDSPSVVSPLDEAKKTVRPNRKSDKEKGFRLVPISEETGMPEGEEIPFEGVSVVLNRDNTDPSNSTITSREQACLTCDKGRWAIEDKSEYKTTFVQAARKTELMPGDLILLGNQLYRFEI